MIYIDSNSKQTKFIRVRDNASILVLTNQTTKATITIDDVINNSKYYIVDFSDYTGYLQNGQYDYVFHSDNQEVLCTGVLQFGDFSTSKAQYETSFEYVQYDPNEPIIEIPEAVIDITKNGTYDVKDFDKANVNVKDEESIVIIGQLEEQITELEDEIEDLEGTVNSYEKEIERLDILKDELQGQIDSVTSINITQNGTYTPPEGILGYNEINVVDEESIVIIEQLEEQISGLENEIETLESTINSYENEIERLNTLKDELQGQINSVTSINITQNGTYIAPEGILGYNEINVETGKPTLVLGSTSCVFNDIQNTELPFNIDSSNCTNFSNMFNGSKNLTTIPYIDTSNGNSFRGMFQNCNKLTTIPNIDTSNGTNFNSMFDFCYRLTSVPNIDTSKGTNFNSMFEMCYNLTTIPLINTSNGINFAYMFKMCSSLSSVPKIDTSKGTIFNSMFSDCSKLTTISQLDVSLGTNFNYMFSGCTALENITLEGSINASIAFYCPVLSYDSVKSILTACSNTINNNSKTLTFDSLTFTDNNSELSDLITTCNSKGWTISGLTLQ